MHNFWNCESNGITVVNLCCFFYYYYYCESLKICQPSVHPTDNSQPKKKMKEEGNIFEKSIDKNKAKFN